MGGALGSALRYGVGRWLSALGGPWPWGTFAVNLVGAFALAFLAGRVTGLATGPRLLLTTGLMGGFTTYSTFNYEVLDLAQNRWPLALAYVAATVAGALVLGMLGWKLGQT